MKNILFNLQLFHLKGSLKTGRNTLYWLLTQNSTKFNLEYQNKNCFGYINIRPLSTIVDNSEKLTQNISEATKNENNIIYNGSLTYQVKGVKVFSCVSSIGGIVIQPWLLENILKGSSTPVGVGLFSFIGFFTFVTPFCIHLLTRKYVTEIWYNSTTDTYTAVVLSFFLRRVNINFKIKDIQIPSALPLFSTMCIKGRPVFVISECFLEVEHYIKMMGYDKPIDFNLNNVIESLNKNKEK